MTYWVYVLSTPNNKVLYVGVTNNLSKRIYQHKNKLVEGFTSRYNITKLLYYDQFSDVNEAISAEKKIKGWTRKKKNILISSLNPYWDDLSKSDPSLKKSTGFLSRSG